ncbi:MAG: ACP S-malonyltransferase [Acaryochloridaceae cyanobacterium RL_2_7]|nr:ACP S-malonyltransferase [Acaryochloridaceae cyanobacterium RL_2_7]
MTKIAWVFPGQGSQFSGMGLDLVDHPIAKERFAQAEEILGWSVIEKCKEDDEALSNTLYTQPCLYVISAILAEIMQAQNAPTPSVLAGHSLGEYVALYVGKVFSFEAGLRLVKRRAELMSQASEGTMVALIGFNRDELTELVNQTENVVLANDNHDGQVVLSGTAEGIDAILAETKVKRKVPLSVSGAFHSPLMATAATEFQELLNSITFEDAKVPVISNVQPESATEAAILKERIIQQMTGPVRWREICQEFNHHGIEEVIEVGPGKVLTGLVKRTCQSVTLTNVNSLESINAVQA